LIADVQEIALLDEPCYAGDRARQEACNDIQYVHAGQVVTQIADAIAESPRKTRSSTSFWRFDPFRRMLKRKYQDEEKTILEQGFLAEDARLKISHIASEVGFAVPETSDTMGSVKIELTANWLETPSSLQPGEVPDVAFQRKTQLYSEYSTSKFVAQPVVSTDYAIHSYDDEEALELGGLLEELEDVVPGDDCCGEKNSALVTTENPNALANEVDSIESSSAKDDAPFVKQPGCTAQRINSQKQSLAAQDQDQQRLLLLYSDLSKTKWRTFHPH
jgi:hypothetical protein